MPKPSHALIARFFVRVSKHRVDCKLCNEGITARLKQCCRHVFGACCEATVQHKQEALDLLHETGEVALLDSQDVVNFQAARVLELRQQQAWREQQQNLARTLQQPPGLLELSDDLQQAVADAAQAEAMAETADARPQKRQRSTRTGWRQQQQQQPAESPSAAHSPPAHQQPDQGQHRQQPDSAAQHAGASSSFAECGGHTADALAFAARHCAEWSTAAADFVADMHACGWCGRVALGGKCSQLRSGMRPMLCDDDAGLPPAALANPMVVPLMQADASDLPRSRRATNADSDMATTSVSSYWWACNACLCSKERRAEMALSVQAPVAEVEADDEASATQLSDWITNLGLLLTLPPGGAMQLAVLRCGVRYAHRLLGYVHALSAADKECPPLLRGPLVCWDEAAVQGADAEELAAALDSLITYLRSNNPVVQRYLTMAERQWGNDTDADDDAQSPSTADLVPVQQHGGVPMVDAACIQDGVAGVQGRDPRVRSNAEPYLPALTVAMDWDGQHTGDDYNAGIMFNVGTMQRRTALAPEEVFGDAAGATTLPTVSLDNALFPFLHPGGVGAFKSGDSLSLLLRQRMQQLFSPFTLVKEYLLVMFQVEAVATLVGGVSESALFSCIQREQQRLPRASPEAVISAVAKQVVPPTVPGSPAYHRNKLQDLLAMVHRHGIPSLFLTLTADEQTALRWPEVAMLEDKAREMTGLPDLQWKDLPVEMARLFTDRVNTFMSRHVLHHAMAILGRINHWVIRYEAQHRGSLHAHILLWVHPADLPKVSEEITATRCRYKQVTDEAGNIVHKPHLDPTDVTANKLFQLVEAKQLHVCRSSKGGCCFERHDCRYGFPFKPNLDGTVFDETSKRYLYSRFCKEDNMVVPYHPAVLLAWGAHVNVQVVTDTAWSFYLLKYAAKEQLPANLMLDGKALQALGLDGVSKEHAELAAATIMSRPVCPCEAALLATNVPLVSSDMDVTFVDTRPPAMRTCRIKPSHTGYTVGPSPVATYTARPHGTHGGIDLDAIKLPRYFELFEVRPAKNKAKPHGAEPQTPLKDDLNQWVWRLREPRIIKRNIAYPTNSNQGFYYNLLLDHVAFRGGRDLLPDGSDYFTECIKRGVFKNTAELDVHLQAYGRYNLYQQLTLDKLRERVNMSCSDLALHALGSPNNAGAEASGQSDSNEAANEAAALQQGLEALQDRLATEGQGCVGEEPGHTSESVPLPRRPVTRAAAAAMAAAEAAAHAVLGTAHVPATAETAATTAADAGAPPHNEPVADPIAALHAAIQGGQLLHTTPLCTDSRRKLEDEAAKLVAPQLLQQMPANIQFGAQQQHAMDTVRSALHNSATVVSAGPGTVSATPQVVALQGAPGCGKSFVTSALVDSLVREQVPVLVTATTATAARRLGLSPADTTHSACQLPVRGAAAPLRSMSAQTLALEKARLVVVDECSMLTSQLLTLLLHRLSQATLPGEPPKVLLLVGDMGQLPPICRHGRRSRRSRKRRSKRHAYLCPHCHLLRCPAFVNATAIELDVVYRQARDPDFVNFLGEIRIAQPTVERLQEALGRCSGHSSRRLEQLMGLTTTVLCTHNRDVRRHNEQALRWHMANNPAVTGPVYAVQMQHNAHGCGHMQQWLKHPGFHLLTSVAQGCRVVYTTTVCKATGATNSAMGTVEEVVLGPPPPGEASQQPWVQALKIRLDVSNKLVTVGRTVQHTTRRQDKDFIKATFPVVLGYAITAHRAQGATLRGRTILHVRKAFAPGMVYVMLSRVTSRDNLFIIGHLKPRDIVPATAAAFPPESAGSGSSSSNSSEACSDSGVDDMTDTSCSDMDEADCARG